MAAHEHPRSGPPRPGRPRLLRAMNERAVLERLRAAGLASRTELTLPFYPHMSHDDQDRGNRGAGPFRPAMTFQGVDSAARMTASTTPTLNA